jgi:DNA polymerase-4
MFCGEEHSRYRAAPPICLPTSIPRRRLLLVPESRSAALCRDCLAVRQEAGRRCGACGSPRVTSHPELLDLAIAHVDCDAFYAAIEKRDDGSLADRPVIVGGAHRGVVSTACYIARIHGVHSAMPMFQAMKLCPQAVVIPPNMAKYAEVAREVRALMLALTPSVEPLSIDEAFLDLGGTERLHAAPPAVVLARFQRQIEREIGITVSIGLSHNKFLAKLASDLDKPRGFSVIGRAETLDFLAAKPVSAIWGVGAAMQARLARDGLTRLDQVQRMDDRTLAARYGAMGLRLARLARGEDDRVVTPERPAKSISAETTFDTDRRTAADLLPILRRLSEKVSGRLKREGLAGRTVVLKLKSADFKLRTRTARFDAPTNLADRLFAAGRELVLRELDGTRFRLIGIGVADIGRAEANDSADLIDTGAKRRAHAELAMDAIRDRFGGDGVVLGLTFETKPRGGKRSA